MLTISDETKILDLKNQILIQKQEFSSESIELLVILNLAFYTGIKQNAIPSLRVKDIALNNNSRPVRLLNYDLGKAKPAITYYFCKYHRRSPKKKKLFSLFKNPKKIQRHLDGLGYQFSTYRRYGKKLFISDLNDAGQHNSDIWERMSDFYKVSVDWIRDNYYEFFLPENSSRSSSPYVSAIYRFRELENEININIYNNNLESLMNEIREKYQQITDQNEKRIIEKLAHDYRFPV